MFDEVDYLEKNLARQIGFVRASETRVAFVVPVLSIGLAIWVYSFENVDFSNFFSVLSGCLALAGFVFAAYFLWLSIFPRTSEPKQSLIFFGSISRLSLNTYSKMASEVDRDQYIIDLKAQIYANACIASEKFAAVKFAMIFWYASLPPLTIFAILSIGW